MNKVSTYALPLAVGSVGLLFTPLAEQDVFSYLFVALAIIFGIVGLQSLHNEKQTEAKQLAELIKQANDAQQASLKQFEALHTSNSELETAITSIATLIEQQSESTKGETAKQFNELTTSLETQHKQLTEAFTQATNDSSTAIEHKLDDGNALVENVSLLMIQELKAVVQLLDEANRMQAELPNELTMLQDRITDNQKEVLESVRDLERHVEKLDDLQQTIEQHLDHSSQSHEQVVEQIVKQFEGVSATVEQRSTQVYTQLTEIAKQSQEQVAEMNSLLTTLEQLQKAVDESHAQAGKTVTQQLNEIKGLNKTFVQGIGQLADSKSAERQHLLKIQKDLIGKFSK